MTAFPPNLQSISMRHLKVITCLHEAGNITKAAHLLYRTRTAVSKALTDFETKLGVSVFARSSNSFAATAEGSVVIARAEVIAKIFSDLAETYKKVHSRPNNLGTIPLFTMDIGTKRLIQIALLANTGSVEYAAKMAGQSTSAIYKSLQDLEDRLNITLFARLPDGRMMPVGFGETLCRSVKLSLSQLQHVIDDLTTIRGRFDGVLKVAGMPSVRPHILPFALAKLSKIHPDLCVRITAGSFNTLANDLFSGDIDIIVGGTRSGIGHSDLQVEVMGQDRICLVAGVQNPISQREDISIDELDRARWVMPVPGQPSHDIFMNCITKSGIQMRASATETGAITTLRGLLMATNAITIGPRFQTYHEQQHRQLKVLPFKLKDDDWPIGLISRKNAPPPNAIKPFILCLKEAIEETESHNL
jgi:LysR family transcriptional regulator, regulator for genes of the gallate degradation pathway